MYPRKGQQQARDSKMLVLLPNNQTEMLMDRKVLEVTWSGSGLDIIETSNLEVDSDFDENSSGMCSFSFKNRMFLIGGKGSRIFHIFTVHPTFRLFRVREPQISGISDSTLPKNNPFRQYVVDLDRNSLSRLDDLPFAFENGRCANINNEYGLLCSPLDGFKNCWIFDGLYNQTYR